MKKAKDGIRLKTSKRDRERLVPGRSAQTQRDKVIIKSGGWVFFSRVMLYERIHKLH